MNPLHASCSSGRLLASVLLVISSISAFAEGRADANRLTYLESGDPFYVGKDFPRLTTPQWVGEPGVEAVVTLAIDDMADTKKYERFLRPILNRLKQIDGRAPVSIMTMSASPDDPQIQSWLKEGLSLEIHTLTHPCPLCEKGNLQSAMNNVYGCVDLMNRIPGNHAVAFRMPCCDSMNSASPRFFAEVFNRLSPEGNFLTLDSSVFTITTTNDSALPKSITLDGDGRERFRKYLVAETNAISKVSMKSYTANVEDYPYPYIIGKLCWEFPCMVPSDWEAQNLHGANSPRTVEDWKAALDATVMKKGVFNLVFHPHNWIRNEQVVELIDYAVSKYGKKVKFLNFREAQQRIDNALLLGQPIRSPKNGQDNGVRLMDVNHDGYMDVIIANETMRKTRIWNPKANQWNDIDFPIALITKDEKGVHHDVGAKFGVLNKDGFPTVCYRNQTAIGAWHFNGRGWVKEDSFFAGLEMNQQPVLTSAAGHDRGVRFRDVDGDGKCELVIGNETGSAILEWQDSDKRWKEIEFSLPEGLGFVDAQGRDMGLRFADLNDDGFDDIIYSNGKEYSVHLFINTPKPHLGVGKGWSFTVQSGKRTDTDAIPMIVRGGTNNNNGAWFRSRSLWVQNEDTAQLPDKVDRRSFSELLTGPEPAPKSPEDSLASIRVIDGFKVELVASEPLIQDPVAFDWGPDGKFWVVEMRDYPSGMDGHGKAGGVIKYLEDTDGDGRYDKATAFLENVNFPNAIMSWRKGVLISAAPQVFYAEDTNGDGKADLRKLLLTGFNEGNQQHRVNGFEYGLDNRVYMANGGSNGKVKCLLTEKEMNIRGHDLSFLPDKGSFRLESGQTQYGRHRDDWGNWFGNENPVWLWHYYLQDQYIARNPYLAVPSNRRTLANYQDNNHVFTIARLQKRFNWADQVYQVTSANSATPYRDDLFGPEFANNVFVSEPANNVIHREVLEMDGATFTSHRAKGEETREFLASTDNWFRPTTIKTGPDGALYIADIYRLVIEHPEYFPEELKKRPDLRAGEDKGRIYRVYPADAKLRKIPRLDSLNTASLVAALDSPNGWLRDMVQRLLVQSGDKSAVTHLVRLLAKSPNPKARLQALCALDGLGAIKPEHLTMAFRDVHPAVRLHAVRIAEPFLGRSVIIEKEILNLVDDSDLRVRFQLAFSLGEWHAPEAGRALGRLALRDGDQSQMQLALLSSATDQLDGIVDAMFSALPAQKPSSYMVQHLTSLAVVLGKHDALAHALDAACKASNQQPATWKLAVMLGFFDGLDRKEMNLARFKGEAKGELKNALVSLDNAFKAIPSIVTNESATMDERQMAIRLLNRDGMGTEQGIQALGKLLGPNVPNELQRAALEGLQHSKDGRIGSILISNWQEYAPGMRDEVLATLFSRPEWTQSLLKALEQETIVPAQISIAHRQQLATHSNAAIRERAVKLFAVANADRQKVIERYQTVTQMKSSAERGAALYKANCALCHRLSGEGSGVGPDLSTVSDKPAAELITSILDPNRAIEVQYASYSALTRDGREFTGIIGLETPNSITFRMPGGAEEVILRKDLKQLTSNKLSLMPDGFESALKEQDMADLIAYITTSTPSGSGQTATKR